jgi:hypothetical protein
MNPRHSSVSRRADQRCEYCHAPEVIFNSLLEVEHIVPRSRQGVDDESNWALACRACNAHKSDYLTGWDEVTQAEVPLFHPRRDLWSEHLDVNLESGLLIGRTPSGRATVTRLQMNAEAQLAARRQWIVLRLFP